MVYCPLGWVYLYRWAVHAIGHELTALLWHRSRKNFGPWLLLVIIDIILIARRKNLGPIIERIWNITEGTLEKKSYLELKGTEVFFFMNWAKNQKLSDYTEKFDGSPKIISNRLRIGVWLGLGEHKSLSPNDVEKIVEMALLNKMEDR